MLKSNNNSRVEVKQKAASRQSAYSSSFHSCCLCCCFCVLGISFSSSFCVLLCPVEGPSLFTFCAFWSSFLDAGSRLCFRFLYEPVQPFQPSATPVPPALDVGHSSAVVTPCTCCYARHAPPPFFSSRDWKRCLTWEQKISSQTKGSFSSLCLLKFLRLKAPSLLSPVKHDLLLLLFFFISFKEDLSCFSSSWMKLVSFRNHYVSHSERRKEGRGDGGGRGVFRYAQTLDLHSFFLHAWFLPPQSFGEMACLFKVFNIREKKEI